MAIIALWRCLHSSGEDIRRHDAQDQDIYFRRTSMALSLASASPTFW